jgi:hypothetical protein
MTNFTTTMRDIANEYVDEAMGSDDLHTCDGDDYESCIGCQMFQHGLELLTMIGELSSVLSNFEM